MARIYRALGATKILIEKLQELGVNTLQSLSDVETHLKESDAVLESRREEERENVRQEIEELKRQYSELMNERSQQRAHHRELLTKELDEIRDRLSQPAVETRNPFKRLLGRYRHWKDSKRKRVLEEHFDDEVDRPLRTRTVRIIETQEQLDYLESNIESVVNGRLAPSIAEKEKTDRALGSLQTWISGARGEKEVVDTLAKLPDTYVVINDFNLRLVPPMASDEGPRFQCQADHLVIGPPGIFNIETKNWSQESVQKLDMRSPVAQIKLTGKAVYREVNRAISERQIRVDRHHWGDRSVSVRNILAMVGAMPKTEFQYVKMLQVSRLCGYIEYFEQMLNDSEVEAISNWLIRTSET